MRLRDAELLRRYMNCQDTSQARLGRAAKCSRQFIHKLVSGQVASCTPEVATRIEDCLRVLPGTLFVAETSCTSGTSVA